MPRERIGRYEVVAQIATGGMGLIYLARTKGIGGFERHVVIKTIDLEGEDHEQLKAMFIDEARLLGVLHHQHIAPVLEIDDDDGQMYIAIEYIHGKTAADVWQRTTEIGAALPVDYCLTVVSAAASGLHYAHTRRGPDGKALNIVHRDVSLSNVMIGFDGAVKLIDFGIAKAANRRVKTQTGFVKGKIGYMAPEQVLRKDVDARTDVFALGIVLYELTTMSRAFREDSDRMTLERIKAGAFRRPTEFVAEYPPELEKIVTRALRVDPRERFPDAESMRAAIEALGHKYELLLGDAAVAEVMHQLFEDRREPWQREARPETSLDVSLEITSDVPADLPPPRIKKFRSATDAVAALGGGLGFEETLDANEIDPPTLKPQRPSAPPKGVFDDNQATAIALGPPPAAMHDHRATPPPASFNANKPVTFSTPPPKGQFDDEQATAIAKVDPKALFATSEAAAISTDMPAARAAKISRLFTESSFNATDTPAKPLDALATMHARERIDDSEGVVVRIKGTSPVNLGDTGEIGGIASIADTTDGVPILPASAVIQPPPDPPKAESSGSSRRILWIALLAIAIGGAAIAIVMLLNDGGSNGSQPDPTVIDATPAVTPDATVAAADAASSIDAAIAAAVDGAKATLDAAGSAAAIDAAPGSRMVTVKITSNPTGATVTLDGLKRLGKTPFDAPVEVPIGPHSIKVRFMGFNTVKIDITADDTAIEKDLQLIKIPPPKKEEPKPDDEEPEKPKNKSKLELPDDD